MKLLVVGNWKMNPKTLLQAKRLFDSAEKGIREATNMEAVICPPFPFLSGIFPGSHPGNRDGFPGTIKLGAQDVFWEKEGAFTGEVSAIMLKDAGCSYVIIGHSERRRYFGETNETVNKKLKAALEAGLKPILCVGETKEERKAGKIKSALKNQLRQGLRCIQYSKAGLKPVRPVGASSNLLNSIIVAYEPVWAIGTGEACRPDRADSAALFVQKEMERIYGRRAKKQTLVLYGGSVSSENSSDYISQDIRGLLVGEASLDAKEFVKIIRSVNNAVADRRFRAS